MEKLSINKLGKFGKKILLPVLAGFTLNAAVDATPLTAEQKNQIALQAQAIEMNFSEANSIANFKNIVESDLNAMTGYDKLEAKVQNEVVGLMTDSAASLMATSEVYRAKEQYTRATSNISDEAMGTISQNRGKNTSDQVNQVVAARQIQDYASVGYASLKGVLFSADAIALNAMDPDGKNQFITFSTEGKRDIVKESTAVVSTLEVNILNYTNYAYAVNGQDGNKAMNLLKQDLAALKSLLSQKGKLSKQDYTRATDLIYHAADILPAYMFGKKEIRVAAITEIAKTYAGNKLLEHLNGLGYDVDKFKAGNFVKEEKKDITFNPSAAGIATNKHIGSNVGFAVNLPINRNWDLSVGSEIGLYKGINDGVDHSQYLATAEAGYTTDNGKHRFAVGLKAGVQHSENGWSVPFGATSNYTYNFDNKLSVQVGASNITNIVEQTNDTLAHASAIIRTGKVNLIFTLAGGYTHTWEKGSTMRSSSMTPTPIPETETTPTQPTTVAGGDQVVQPQGDTTDLGSTDNYPQQPVNPADYSKLY